MYTKKYEKEFLKIGIDIKPVPSYYSPDSFGRELMRNVQQSFPISYSADTILTGEEKKVEEMEPAK